MDNQEKQNFVKGFLLGEELLKTVGEITKINFFEDGALTLVEGYDATLRNPELEIGNG